ncbi:MAG TPA: glycosyltransferase family 4 protein [Vicinamibacteria bacterium]|nr:glycosyltransferase family 4 protein [Vicinamibacteria bacterium]
MRILHVAPFYEPAWAYGGMARSSAALCRALARRGHEVTVTTALLDPSHAREESRDGVRVVRFPGPDFLKARLVPWAPGLRTFLAREMGSFDLGHLHGHRSGLAFTAARALRASRRPFVLMPHGTYPAHGQYPRTKAVFDRLLGDRIVQGAAALLAVSDREAQDLPRPARVIPNGVEPCGRAEPGPPGPRRRLLFVGTDRPQKRGSLLPALLSALPSVDLHLAGQFEAGFRRTFGAAADRVTACGVLAGEALAAQYASADVVVHPAVGEAFGLVPFEAALAGTAAVVAGDHGCGEWFARAGGCVVPPDDAGALIAAVRVRLEEPERARAEARAVADFARRHLTWDAAAAAVESVYAEVLGARA